MGSPRKISSSHLWVIMGNIPKVTMILSSSSHFGSMESNF